MRAPRPSPPPSAPGPWALGALVVAALGVLGWAATRQGLHFVDLVSFSRRARELAAHTPPSDGLYPLGYPTLLALGHALGAPVLGAARAVSVAAGVGLVVVAGRRLGPAAGLWLLVQLPFLTWASTEGTDLPAAALALAGVLSAAAQPRLAGLLLGAALTVRWTAAAWVPAALLAAAPGSRVGLLVAAAVGTLPHWLASAWCGTLVLPNQDLNLAIAAGPGAAPAEAGVLAALRRVPEGLGRAWPHALSDVYARAGAALLALAALWPARPAPGAWRSATEPPGQADRRLAAGLLLGACLHLVALAAVFANARLALPAALAAALGAPMLLARLGPLSPWAPRLGGLGLAALALGFGSRTVPRLAEPSGEAEQVEALREALAGVPSAAPVMANSPLVHTEVDGWLVPGIQLGGLYVTPRTTPEELARVADQHGLTVLVLDPTRGARDTAGLVALREADVDRTGGWVRRSAGRWRVWERSP